jgi:hypothetical protein
MPKVRGAMHTLMMGPAVRVYEDVSKGQIVELCKELAEFFGEGYRFKPLAGHGLLSYESWPGRLECLDGEGISGKELRLLVMPCAREMPILWPGVPPDAMEVWRGDEDVALRVGQYRTQLVSYGAAEMWRMEDIERMKEVFSRYGWRVSNPKNLRGWRNTEQPKRPEDSRYYYRCKKYIRKADRVPKEA